MALKEKKIVKKNSGEVKAVIKKKKSKNLLQSFGYAIDGIAYALKTVRNLKIHLLFTALVVFGGLFFRISRTEYLICLVFVALVISLELVNTALEEVVDLASPDIHPIAKRSKDVAAGAVLLSAVISFVVGCAIFIPRILTFLRG